MSRMQYDNETTNDSVRKIIRILLRELNICTMMRPTYHACSRSLSPRANQFHLVCLSTNIRM